MLPSRTCLNKSRLLFSMLVPILLQLPACAASGPVSPAAPPAPDAAGAALAEALVACLPPAPEAWEAHPVEIDEKKTDVPKGRIEAQRFYRDKTRGSPARVLIRIESSAWDVWLADFASDLQRIEFGKREGVMDLTKHSAIVYVPVTGNVCAVFRGEDQPKKVEGLARSFAEKTDFECMEKLLKK